MDPDFLRRLFLTREEAGIPFVITSGYRCHSHNLEVGSTSENHTSGKAADIECTRSDNRLLIIKALLTEFERFGLGPDFIHVDSMPKLAAVWLY